MSTPLQTAQQTSRLDFLFTAGFDMLKIPSLSRYYMNEFHNTLIEYELSAAKPIERTACLRCGQIYMPGLSTKVEITKKKRGVKKNQNKKNKIETTCLVCCHTTKYHGSYKKKLPKPMKDTPIQVQATAAATTKPTIDNKKKKNKGKKNNLKALLNKSSTNNNNSSNNLTDFLSSL